MTESEFFSNQSTRSLVSTLAAEAGRQHRHVVTAESCTGGLLAAYCTHDPGSSGWFEASFVTYTNAAKQVMLGVPNGLLERFGAVSEPVARAMAEGALGRCGADLAVAITGIAGPGGGEPILPVGTVWFAWALRDDPLVVTASHMLAGSRDQIREAAVRVALQGLADMLKGPAGTVRD